MNWSRMKTILIFLFLVVDLVLLTSILIPSAKMSRIPQKTIEETATLCKNRGIEISPENIPKKRERLGIVELYNIWPNNSLVAEKMLGKGYVGSGNTYTNGSKKLEILDKELIYTNANCEKTISYELSGFGIALRENIYEDGENNLHLWQTVEGKKLFESELYATLSNKKFSLTGFWFFSDKEKGIIKNTPDTLVDVTGVLIDFINNPVRDLNIKITSVEIGYSAGKAYRDTVHKLVSVSPAYKISTDTGAYYLYDAFSGAFLYANKNGEIIY